MMTAHGAAVLVAATAGAPESSGWIRYLVNGEAWGGRAFAVVEPGRAEPTVVLESDDLVGRVRQTATTSRIEGPSGHGRFPVERVIEIVADISGGSGRVDLVGAQTAMTSSECETFRRRLPHVEVLDVTHEANAIRQTKSLFEIEAIRETGRILAGALDVFAERARPGRPASEVLIEVEAFLHHRGCRRSTVSYSLERSDPSPPDRDRRFTQADVIVVRIVASGPLGYWYELSGLFAFARLTGETDRRLKAIELAYQAGALAVTPGHTAAALSSTLDRVLRDQGINVIRRHAAGCHHIGTDRDEASGGVVDDWVFKPNMVLVFHPGAMREDDPGAFISETVQVRPDGAVPLSPRGSIFKRIYSEQGRNRDMVGGAQR
ncbi:MAG: M24 family metallopeptidase [Armatimonadota bacterium]